MIKWQYRETRDSEIARFAVCGIVATVQDCDGDFSAWSVRRAGRVYAEGEFNAAGSVYHFDMALGAAEGALRAVVNLRKMTLSGTEEATEQ